MRSTCFISLLFMIFFHIFGNVRSANILSLIEVLEPEQQIWYDALFKGLIGKGHTLTIVSGNVISTKSPHITQIHLEQITKTTTATLMINKSSKLFANSLLRPFEQLCNWYDRQMKICKGALSSNGLQELIEITDGSMEEQPFDLILYDATYGQSCLMALAQQLFENVPIVALSASNITPALLSIARGAQVQPATVPHFLTAHNENMNFFERLHNTVIYALGDFVHRYIVTNVQEAMLSKSEQLLKSHIKPKLKNPLIDRIKVVLVNSHPSIDYVHSLPPNVIEVGGLQFDNVNRALSVEMQTFIDNSKNGVFIITLGREEIGKGLTDALIEAVMNIVERFPEYGFLWGLDENLLDNVGSRSNLFMGKWLRTIDVLAQRKVKGLITAGSHMEIQEAVYHGVPIILTSSGLNNIAQRVQDLGIGILIDLDSDPEMLTIAIKEISSSQKFTDNVKSRKMAFRNRPQHPLDEALWWIEHVLVHPNESDYLFSQAVAETNFFVLHSLDVIAVFVFMCVMFLINCFIVLKQLKESCRTTKQSSNKIESTSTKRKLKKTESNKKKSQ